MGHKVAVIMLSHPVAPSEVVVMQNQVLSALESERARSNLFAIFTGRRKVAFTGAACSSATLRVDFTHHLLHVVIGHHQERRVCYRRSKKCSYCVA